MLADSHLRDDRGSITVELAILAPALLLLLGLLVFAGRVQTSSASVEQAARAAARKCCCADAGPQDEMLPAPGELKEPFSDDCPVSAQQRFTLQRAREDSSTDPS